MAKTYKNLYPQIANFEALHQAWHLARKGKRYQPNVAAFAFKIDVEIMRLRHELETQIWQPGAYRSFTIHEPKRRKISAAPFADRVVHHALIRIIEEKEKELSRISRHLRTAIDDYNERIANKNLWS